jgi:multiple sugar transport system substrate-binding protein
MRGVAASERSVSRRSILATLGAALGGPALAACGGQVAAPSSQATGPATIEFSFWGDPRLVETFNKDIADFNQDVPNVLVKTIHNPSDYYTKLETLIVGGTPPDIAMMAATNAPNFTAKGALRNLDAQIKKDGNVDDLYPSVREAMKVKGVLYGLPRDVTTFPLFYNQQLFDEAGVKYPDANWTWTSLLDAARRITKASGDAPVYGFHHRPLYDQTMPWIWQNGGAFLNRDQTACVIDQAPATEALQWLADLKNVHQAAPRPNALGTEDQGRLFLERRIAMYINGYSSGISFRGVQGLRYDVAPLPQGKQRATVVFPIMYTIPKDAKYPDQAFTFMKFLAGPKAQRNHAVLGAGFPGYRSVAESDVFLKNDVEPKSKRVFLDMLAYGRPIDAPEVAGSISAPLLAELAPVWEGTRTAREATAEIKRQVDQILKTGK